MRTTDDAELGPDADRASDSVSTRSDAAIAESARPCAQCGIPFELRPRGRNARFCRATCRARWHTARKAALLAELEEILGRAAVLLRELREGTDSAERDVSKEGGSSA